MKTIDVKSMLIGFLLCAVGFLTIGATGRSGDAGRYVLNKAALLDSSTGQMYILHPDQDFILGEKREWITSIEPVSEGSKY